MNMQWLIFPAENFTDLLNRCFCLNPNADRFERVSKTAEALRAAAVTPKDSLGKIVAMLPNGDAVALDHLPQEQIRLLVDNDPKLAAVRVLQPDSGLALRETIIKTADGKLYENLDAITLAVIQEMTEAYLRRLTMVPLSNFEKLRRAIEKSMQEPNSRFSQGQRGIYNPKYLRHIIDGLEHYAGHFMADTGFDLLTLFALHQLTDEQKALVKARSGLTLSVFHPVADFYPLTAWMREQLGLRSDGLQDVAANAEETFKSQIQTLAAFVEVSVKGCIEPTPAVKESYAEMKTIREYFTPEIQKLLVKVEASLDQPATSPITDVLGKEISIVLAYESLIEMANEGKGIAPDKTPEIDKAIALVAAAKVLYPDVLTATPA